MLMQEHHPLAYLSRALGPRLRGLSTYEKESLAMLLAVDRWRPYLQAAPFTIRTDQRALAHLDEQRLSTPWQQKALTKLLGLQYTIEYKKGSTNQATDALSRHPAISVSEVLAITVGTPEWIEDIREGYKNDATAQAIMDKLQADPKSVKNFTWQENLLRYKGRIWVGRNVEMQQAILQYLHAGAVGGHSGVQATLYRIRQMFAWPRLKLSVQKFVGACPICKQAKPEHVKSPGLLQPLPIPAQPWGMVTLDFVEGLPKSAAFSCVLVVVDKLTKYAHFIPLSHPYTALQVAQAYFENVFKLHGMPEALVSDRDPVFDSKVWHTLFKLSRTELRMSTTRHPQTDGQTERVNQCFETYLRSFINACPSKWSQWLPLAEFWYNTSYHTAIKTTPFCALYGHQPRYFGVSDTSVPVVADLHQWLQERRMMTDLLRQHLSRAQERMKTFADRKRSERSFVPGDWAFLRVQPYIQTSLGRRANAKLAFRYFGPYQILAPVGNQAYRLQLPDNAKIHPVFHVSQLRAGAPPSSPVHEELPLIDDESQPLQIPEQVLDKRRARRCNNSIDEVLIKWSDLPSSLATWENELELRERFPRAPAWGQAAREGGRNVMGLASKGQPKGPSQRVRRQPQPSTRFPSSTWVTTKRKVAS